MARLQRNVLLEKVINKIKLEKILTLHLDAAINMQPKYW